MLAGLNHPASILTQKNYLKEIPIKSAKRHPALNGLFFCRNRTVVQVTARVECSIASIGTRQPRAGHCGPPRNWPPNGAPDECAVGARTAGVTARKRLPASVSLTEVLEAEQQPAAYAADLLIATRMIVTADERGTKTDIRSDADRALNCIARINANRREHP